MFERILIATDGSEHAKRATAIAGDIAAKYDAELTIVHVAPSWISLADIKSRVDKKKIPNEVVQEINHLKSVLQKSRSAPGRQWDTFIPAPVSAVQVLSNQIIGEAEETAKQKGVNAIVPVICVGRPAEEILEQANKIKPGMIVLGTRGLTSMRGVVLGSVSHKVIHAANCPVLTIK